MTYRQWADQQQRKNGCPLRILRWMLLVGALALLLAGCMFPQGWHWPRTIATGSPTNNVTVVYFAARYGLASYQLAPITWAAGYYNGHPELDIRVVDRCPAGRNCVLWRTEDLTYPVVGRTTISFNSFKHLLSATVMLDIGVDSRSVVFHEACHAFGGGFTPPGSPSIHELCNWAYRSLIFDEVARVYHADRVR